MKKCKTQFLSSAVEEKVATAFYEYLRDNISWEEGIRSRKGFTRWAKALDPTEYEEIADLCRNVLSCMEGASMYFVYGIYVNYYVDGSMYTPTHSHPGTHQLVISLGASRILQVGSKSYVMKNGDAILFGSSTHGVPKEETVSEGRISIATFMTPWGRENNII